MSVLADAGERLLMTAVSVIHGEYKSGEGNNGIGGVGASKSLKEAAILWLVRCLYYLDIRNIPTNVRRDITLQDRLVGALGMTAKDTVLDLIRFRKDFTTEIRTQLARVMVVIMAETGTWPMEDQVEAMGSELCLLILDCKEIELLQCAPLLTHLANEICHHIPPCFGKRVWVMMRSVLELMEKYVHHPYRLWGPKEALDVFLSPTYWGTLWSRLFSSDMPSIHTFYLLLNGARERGGLGFPPTSLLFPNDLVEDISLRINFTELYHTWKMPDLCEWIMRNIHLLGVSDYPEMVVAPGLRQMVGIGLQNRWGSIGKASRQLIMDKLDKVLLGIVVLDGSSGHIDDDDYCEPFIRKLQKDLGPLHLPTIPSSHRLQTIIFFLCK